MESPGVGNESYGPEVSVPPKYEFSIRTMDRFIAPEVPLRVHYYPGGLTR
jgi:hypothetical protein